jgi:hypothetical protein
LYNAEPTLLWHVESDYLSASIHPSWIARYVLELTPYLVREVVPFDVYTPSARPAMCKPVIDVQVHVIFSATLGYLEA